ncbi:response regulator [Chryseolinea lacunae]|uniref:Response regulator n=1 Tax=Chryseolinea lacunae TaxID=2801331 RepID=A0ABS1L2Z5_9BACT|nr:response regulator [Chryseolinea lacunae]MBL0745312.1 response regulator [Chryseolinea lacunae]
MTAVGKKILIVDDDTRNIFALTAVLKSRGYPCLSAPGGEEGLHLLSTTDDIGMVLLDMMMPEMDGYEVIAKIRESERSHLPIIAVTAQAMVGDREKCLAAGADAYLSKPIDIDVLVDEMEKLQAR